MRGVASICKNETASTFFKLNPENWSNLIGRSLYKNVLLRSMTSLCTPFTIYLGGFK